MEGYRAMSTPELIEDYLIDRNNGMKNVIAWFLNQVMQQEALNQIKANLMSAPIRGKRYVTV
jgi:hypothetical protein